MENGIVNRKQKHLTEFERGEISALISQGYSAYKIAKLMNRAENTIRNEIRKGTTTIILHGWKEKTMYFPERGQAVYEQNRQRVCTKLKLEKDRYKPFLEYVETMFFTHKWGIETIYNIALKNKLFKKENTVCPNTIYSYIDKGYLKIKNIDLPNRTSRKPTKKNVSKKRKHKYGTSIEERPAKVTARQEFGHWEIDTVLGRQDKKQSVLLVLTERKSRMEIIRKISSKSSESVMHELEKIQEEFGNKFSNIFQTITSDNGTEFSMLHKLENATNTKIYYAHPFSSFERGSNERNNRIIRYFIKKGVSINDISKEKIHSIEEWINNLPRKILNFETAFDVFKEETEKISV